MVTSAQTLTRDAPRLARWSVSREVCLTAIAAAWGLLLAILATYNLELYPTTWFDEGSHLHVPKTLVQFGVYADISSEGFRYFGPTAGVGPTVMLPIALAFAVAGIGLIQARLVMVAYLLLGVALFTLVARRQYGWATAWLAALFLVTAPGINLLYLGRQVLGEVPALAFLMLGILLWWSCTGPAPAAAVRLLGAGLAFGLAALTKSQLALILVPTFALLLIADRLYYRQGQVRHFVVPLSMVLAAMVVGLLVQMLPLLGTAELGRTLALWREASAGAVFTFSLSRALSSVKFLAGPDAFAYWGVPALLYGLTLARPRTLGGLQQALLVTLAIVGFGWYTAGSIGWPRYAFPSLAVTAIFAAKLFHDLFIMSGHPARAGAVGHPRLAVMVGAALIVVHPLVNQVRAIATASDRSPQLVATYLDATVPHADVVETWEPELGFLTQHRYHYPPSGWLDRAVRAKWLAGDAPLRGYDPIREADPAYLVVGRFAKYTGVYSSIVEEIGAPPIASFGEYDVYTLAGRRPWPGASDLRQVRKDG